MSIAIVFPGQGSQKVGMGKPLYEAFATARHVFQEVDDALGEKLSTLIFEGDDPTLTLTQNAQPALMAVSMAVVRVLEKDFGVTIDRFACAAGHSLGEYSALAAIGVVSLADTARLLRIRGNAMQAAVPVGEGGMAALLGLDMQTVETVVAAAQEAGICAIANDNSPGQVVVSGALPAVEKAMALAKEHGAKRAVLLPVSAPFHSPLMAPAAESMQQALAKVSFVRPEIPYIANISAQFVEEPEAIKASLVDQVTGRVRWTETIQRMASEQVTSIVELGAGRVLTGLTKRIAPEIVAESLSTPDEIDAFVNDTLK